MFYYCHNKEHVSHVISSISEGLLSVEVSPLNITLAVDLMS